jgi:hypothetical protein
VKSSLSLADLRGFYLRPSAWNLLFLFSLIYADFLFAHLREIFFSFLADLRGFYLRPSEYFQSAFICVKSSFSLADLRGFFLLSSAYL